MKENKLVYEEERMKNGEAKKDRLSKVSTKKKKNSHPQRDPFTNYTTFFNTMMHRKEPLQIFDFYLN